VTEQRVQRRLAAILAADVVGYSALMQRAEEATYAEFERLKCEVIEPGFSRHDGRLIKTTGDGALAEFASPSAAVRCAQTSQTSQVFRTLQWCEVVQAHPRSTKSYRPSSFR
jgi:adenylate cyclase